MWNLGANFAFLYIKTQFKLGKISTLLDRIAHAQRLVRSAKIADKQTVNFEVGALALSPILHSALIFAHAQFYLRGCLLGLLPVK